MKNQLILVCAFFLISIKFSGAQQSTFQLRLTSGGSNEDAAAAIENANGNIVIATSSYLNNQLDVVIAEVSSSGNLLQQFNYGTSGNEIVKSIIQTSDNSYLITGAVYSTPSDYDWFIIKLDPAFGLLWYKRYATTGNDLANSCYEISPDHFIVTGTVAHGGSAKPSVVRIDGSGNVLGEGYLTTNQFASPNYRGRYLGNGVVGFVNLANAFAVLDTNGTLIKNCSFNNSTFTRDIASSGNGGFAAVGVAGFGGPSGSGLSFIITDSSLTSFPVAVKFSTSIASLEPAMMTKDAAGNYWIAATETSLSSGNEVPVIMKISASGSLLFAKSVMPPAVGGAGLRSISILSDGGILVSGRIAFGSSSFIAKIDSSGNGCNVSNLSVNSTVLSSISTVPHTSYIASLNNPLTIVSSTSAITLNQNLLCATTSITEESFEKPLVTVLPTLFHSGFEIRCEVGMNVKVQMKLTDMQGRAVLLQDVVDGQFIDTDQLSQGFYLLTVFSGSSILGNPIRLVRY